jgi:hypothetical protein
MSQISISGPDSSLTPASASSDVVEQSTPSSTPPTTTPPSQMSVSGLDSSLSPDSASSAQLPPSSTPSPPFSSGNAEQNNSNANSSALHLSSAAIAGIFIAVIAILLVAITYLVIRNRKRQQFKQSLIWPAENVFKNSPTLSKQPGQHQLPPPPAPAAISRRSVNTENSANFFDIVWGGSQSVTSQKTLRK